MKKILFPCVFVLASMAHAPATVAQAQQALAVCLTDSLNGRERKQLAQWIFFAMSAHPELNDYTSISSSARDDSDRFIGGLLTRLLTEDCPAEASRAIREGGSQAMEGAFEIVGAVAMQELMTDQDVVMTLQGFEKYIDQSKFEVLATP